MGLFSTARLYFIVLVCVFYGTSSVDALHRSKSSVIGKIVSCVSCDNKIGLHARSFAKEHTALYKDLGVEEVEGDVHELVVHDRESGEEVARHDISGMNLRQIQSLVVKNGIRVQPPKSYKSKGRYMRAEIQHCATCDSLRQHDAHKHSRKLMRDYHHVSVSRNTVRNTHDLVVFDATGKEVVRHDLSSKSVGDIHKILTARGFKFQTSSKPTNVLGTKSRGSKHMDRVRRLETNMAVSVEGGAGNRKRAASAARGRKSNTYLKSRNDKFNHVKPNHAREKERLAGIKYRRTAKK